MSTKQRGRKAWLVTWEWCGGHARREPKVVAVFKPQLSGDSMRPLVECIYSCSEYSLRERMDFALNPKANPYPAQFNTIDGVPWAGEIICGANPFLRARLVDNLLVDEESNATWDERKRPSVANGVQP